MEAGTCAQLIVAAQESVAKAPADARLVASPSAARVAKPVPSRQLRCAQHAWSPRHLIHRPIHCMHQGCTRSLMLFSDADSLLRAPQELTRPGGGLDVEREKEKGLWFNCVGCWWGRVSEELLKAESERVERAHKSLEVLVMERGLAWQLLDEWLGG